MALAEHGEAALVYCSCGWAANVEAAEAVVARTPAVTEPREMEKVHTPNLKTIKELADAFEIAEHDTVKTMAGRTPEGRLVFFLVPGDRELNPIKAEWAVPGVELLDEEQFKEFDIPRGSLGPVNPPHDALLVADRSLEGEVSWNVGANEEDYHFFGAQPHRDFEVAEWVDLAIAQPGDACPDCGGVLEGARGIEVSQVFQLGTKYSEAMGATFNDEDGSERHFIMGCYGVGVSRSLAAVIEQHHDEDGILWPMSTAPLEVAVIPLAIDDDEVYPVAERLWNELADLGIEVVLDDRSERPGVKFADNDLIGLPYQVVVGKKGLAEDSIELKDRRTGERSLVPLVEAVAHVAKLVEDERVKFAH
jgi:prolyl-tRNA synthetase